MAELVDRPHFAIDGEIAENDPIGQLVLAREGRVHRVLERGLDLAPDLLDPLADRRQIALEALLVVRHHRV